MRRRVFGEAGLPRHLDGDWPHESAEELLLGAEDGAENAAGLNFDQLVLAGEGLAQQTMLERWDAFHGAISTPKRIG